MAEIISLKSFRRKRGRRPKQKPSMYRPKQECRVIQYARRYPKQKEGLVLAQYIMKPGKKGEYPTFEED